MEKMKIGLLPLYIKLYDDISLEFREPLVKFYGEIQDEFIKQGLSVVTHEICREAAEFKQAIELFEKEEVDCIMTLHLAYSPSLESSEILANTKLPIIVLDTTPAYEFSSSVDSGELMKNHGIHGVQDMCNLLKRNGKEFNIVAGHWKRSDVIKRAIDIVRAVKIAKNFKNSKVGTIGNSFKGMGDFIVEKSECDNLGIEIVEYDFNRHNEYVQRVTESEIYAEIISDLENYKHKEIDQEAHKNSTQLNLAIRKWIEEEQLDAFTFNFMDITSETGLYCVPFLEACKQMGKGIGYAGEGDVLTAALTGAIMSIFKETSFIEMFCPDWENNTIFISHMGEMNLELSQDKPVLVENDYTFSSVNNPVLAYATYQDGKAVIVDLAPLGNGEYNLILSKVTMLRDNGVNNFKESISGWFKPETGIINFLEKYSQAGGTHHLVLVYGEHIKELELFGKMMGWKIKII